MQSENGSLVYYVPGYSAYAPGTYMGVDGQSVGQQQYFSSSGFLQQPVSYSWDTTFNRDVPNGANLGLGNSKTDPGSTGLARSNALNSVKTNGSANSKFPKSLPYTQLNKPLNKVCNL